MSGDKTNKLNVSRRQTLAGGLALGLASSQASAQQVAQPNILWLVSEDNNPFLGAYGDPVAQTPNLDAFAKQGVRFENVFSNAPVCAPTRFAIITGMYPESCGPGEHMRAEGKLPPFVDGFPTFLRKRGYYCTNNAKTDYNSALDPSKIWDDSSAKAHWKNRAPGQPFFAVFNTSITHESSIFRDVEGPVKPEVVRIPAYLPDVPEVRADIAKYHNLMHRMDAWFAGMLKELDDAGLTNDTIVFYYSDNGGVLPRSKRYCFDSGLRTAMIVRTPARFAGVAAGPAGAVVSNPVSYIDLAPTVVALSGQTPPAYMQGKPFMGPRKAAAQRYAFGMRNRMDERYDMVRTVRDQSFRYIRNYAPHRPAGQHQAFAWQQVAYQAWEREFRAGRLNAEQSAFFKPRVAEEFYDLRLDRDEVKNLIGAPEHQARIAEMRKALDTHMMEIGDNGFIPESAAAEGYEASRRPGAYPLAEVMSLAGLAIRQDVANMPAFLSQLSSKNEVMRYWAAQGVLMLGDRAASALARVRAMADAEQSLQVRVPLLEVLARLGDAKAVGDLAEILGQPGDKRVRLQAINALTFVGKPAEAALPQIEAAAVDPDEYLKNAGRYLSLILKGQYQPNSQVFPGFAGGA